MGTNGGSGRAYVVLGATGAIGSTLCRLLSARGDGLLLAARDQARLQALSDELQAPAISLNATNFDHVEACLRQAAMVHESLDGVACCVGSLLAKPAHAVTQEEWMELVDSNLGAAFATARAAGSIMREKGGSVVLVSAAVAQTGVRDFDAFAAAKAGIIGLTRSAAATYARFGLRFNCVAPGIVESPQTKELLDTADNRRTAAAMHPLNRVGRPADVAQAMSWLLDPAQSWVTGQVLGVDGGLARARP